MTTETAAVFGFDDGIMVIPSNPSASRISIYRDGQLIPVGGDMPFFHIRHAVAWGTDVFMVGTNNKVYFGSFVHTTSGWILDGCQEIDVVIPDSAAQYNFRKLALNGGYLFIWDNSTLRRFVIERTQDRVSLSYDSDCVSDVNRWIPCSDGAVFGSSTGIFRLFGGAAGYIDVPNQAQTVIFIGDSYFNDAPEYGTASVADEIFNLNFFRFEDEFVRLNDDVDNTTPVTSLDVQFGCVFATMPKLKGRMAVKKPTTLYDIGNLVDGYKLVFSEAKQVSPVDFGFVYLPENNTAYVFSKNYVCEWGAYSD